MPLAKINYFLNEAEEGEERTSVFLHYRMDRALRAKTSVNMLNRPEK